jgi:very-short-patch-repair endonuclease
MVKNANKSPKRKLKLELIEGKTYIQEKDILHYYVEKNWNIADFMVHFGLGHRIVRRSITMFIPKEKRSEIRGNKTRQSQLSKNSNSVNWYKPRNLIELEKLKSAIESSKNQSQLLKTLGITKYVLTSNLQYYNLHLPPRKPYGLSLHDLTNSDLDLLKKLTPFHKGLDLLLSEDKKQVSEGIFELAKLAFEIKLLSRKVRRYHRNLLKDNSVKFPANLVEYCFMSSLDKLGINYEMQFRIGKRSFDFLIEGKLIVELDGHLHADKIDKEKDKLAISNGYTLIRLPLKELKLVRFKQKEDFILCIKKYVLPALNK